MPRSAPSQPPPPRIVIEHEAPRVDAGRYPVKRTPGDTVRIAADIFRDGHEQLRAVVRFRSPLDRRWREAPLVPIDEHVRGVRWAGEFAVEGPIGRWRWQVLAWVDRFASWREELERKLDAGQQELGGELSEGVVILREAAAAARGAARRRIAAAADALELPGVDPRLALDPDLAAVLAQHPDRSEQAAGAEQELQVDPQLARFGSWYELFPRSWGGLAGTIEQVPRLAELGFDVLYLPPIHPIGRRNRKGRNNSLVAGPDDPGSPYAIGAAEGGHTAVDPSLGTVEDVERLAQTCEAHGMSVALDFAIQCSADHPWLEQHPEWFNRRPDGTLKYAENPPKKYQDIYNFDFNCADWRGLWKALRGIVRFWIDRGVRVFRVDNPHTKPLAFWEWLLADIRKSDPDVVFLAEAFTRRRVMQALAKAGFQQSYTYFTWKNSRWELSEYFGELAHSEERDYFRPNAFVNTPDILSEYLQVGGPNAFPVRLLLAATLSPSYGIYSGFESFEHTPVRPGSEEYLDSEKYETKQRALDGPLLPLVATVNRIRRENPALQRLDDSLRFLETRNDALIAYLKRDGGNVVLTVVNIDFEHAQEGLIEVPWEAGLPTEFTVTDLLTVERFDWRTGGNYVRLVPGERAGHVLRVDTA